MEYTTTSGELGRQAGVTAATIRTYSSLGLLDYITVSNGTRLFRTGQAATVRRIYAQRMANKGRPLAPESGPQAV